MIAAVLGDQSYPVLSRSSATAGDIESLAPSLIIIELLPSAPLVGLALIRRLRRAPQTRATPIIVTSTDPQLLCRGDLDGQGCVRLAKPFDLDDLLACVQQALADVSLCA